MSTKPVPQDAAVAQLAETIAGEAIRADHPQYDTARAVWNGMIDRRPALIVRCRGVNDVISAVDFARANAMEVAIRGGGHSVTGASVVDDGMVIDLSQMKGVKVDPEARTVTAQAGLTWGELDAATQEHGLAVTGGRISTTGISGLTLGSGSGWLERAFGLTVDNLLSVELVAADGRVVVASKTENPELFWALRGAGGNFGVVTTFEYALHPVGPMVLGGLLIFPAQRAREVVTAYRDIIESAPDELGGAVAMLSAPPEPFVPEEMHGAPVCGIAVCCIAPAEEAERLVQPLKDLGPVMDMTGPMPYTVVQQLLDNGNPPGLQCYMKADFTAELPDDAIDAVVEHAYRKPSPISTVILQPMGGAYSRVPNGDTPIGHREAKWCYHAIGLWQDAEQDADNIEWARALGRAMEPYSVAAVYPNYTSDVTEEGLKATYGPEKFARLVAVKDEWDPTNMFHLNANIRPSIEAAGRAERPDYAL
jgi:FAD/FMN-containing dehydrogenase